jgi:hypothetical protein
VERCIISKKEEKDENDKVTSAEYILLVEGTDLKGVMNTKGVDGYNTTMNHITVIESVSRTV